MTPSYKNVPLISMEAFAYLEHYLQNQNSIMDFVVALFQDLSIGGHER